jgi:hypothetical protein
MNLSTGHDWRILIYFDEKKEKYFFLGESYRADALTWTNGLKEFGDFEIISWELKHPDTFFNRILRIIEFKFALLKIKKIIKRNNLTWSLRKEPRVSCCIVWCKTSGSAQQGQNWPMAENSIYYRSKLIQNYAFKKP